MTSSAEPFVGRGFAVAEVSRVLADADAGTGGLLLVSGPAGIGKTRLLEEATAAAETPVLWGRCVDDPGAPPLWPWRRILRDLPGPAFTEPGRDPQDPADPADPVAAQFHFVAAAADTLVAAASPQGLVIVLEDLHWADDASLRLLRHLSGELRRSRLAVLATYRDSEPGPVLSGILPDLLRRPGAQGLTVAPLTEPDVREFLSGRHRATAAEVRDVLRRSGGNPLYLKAVVRSAASADGGREQLGRLVRTAVASLDPGVRELLAIAAVLGEDVDSEVLANVSGFDSGTVARGLDQAVRAGVLDPVPLGAGLRRFAHAVVRDGIYADLAPSVRESLHARTAAALEDRARRDPALAGVVAGHWLRAAGDAATLARAAEWALRAADEATRSLAFAEAARFLTFAWQAHRRAGDADRLPELLVRLATAEYRSGRFGHSLAHANEAAALAQARGDHALVVAAALIVRDTSAPDLLPRLAELAATALSAAGPDADPAVRSRLVAQSSSVAADAGRMGEATKLATEALALAEESGDAEALIDAVRARFKIWPIELALAERLRLATLAIELGGRTRQPLLALWGHKWRLDAALEVGTMTVVDEEISAVSALAGTTRLPLVRWHDLRLRASVLAYRGSFAQARKLNSEASELAITELAEDWSTAGMSHAFCLQLALITGDPGELSEGCDEMLANAPDLPITLVSGPLAALAAGRREEALARYEALRPRVRDPAFLTQNAGVAQNLLTSAVAFDDRETTSWLAEHFANVPPMVAGGAGIFCSDSSSSWQARAAAVLGRHDDAVRWFEEAIAIDIRVGARPYVALDRLGLAEALLARAASTDLARAETLARQAVDEMRRLGMPGPVRRAGKLLERVHAADPLTSREREIATLLAASLSNRQIADRLVLSERTVESHVRSILAKLGLANRLEIADWARRTGAAP